MYLILSTRAQLSRKTLNIYGKHYLVVNTKSKLTIIYRYDFDQTKTIRAKLRELGPRFTLRLKSLQHGTFDSKYGDYEWIIQGRRHDMETSRRKFFL